MSSEGAPSPENELQPPPESDAAPPAASETAPGSSTDALEQQPTQGGGLVLRIVLFVLLIAAIGVLIWEYGFARAAFTEADEAATELYNKGKVSDEDVIEELGRKPDETEEDGNRRTATYTFPTIFYTYHIKFEYRALMKEGKVDAWHLINKEVESDPRFW